MSNWYSGQAAELWVVRNLTCPLCDFGLEPHNRPMVDLRCTHCNMQYQVKRYERPPGTRLPAGSWLTTGAWKSQGWPLPPVLHLWGWGPRMRAPEAVDLYPFIPYTALTKKNVKSRAPQTWIHTAHLPRLRLWPQPGDQSR